MDFSTISLDTASCLAAGLLVIGGYAAIWAVKKVIILFQK